MIVKFYVYRYIRLDKNTPFYVGKGCGNRIHRFSDRNKYFLNIVKSIPYRAEIIMNNLDEKTAFVKETELIGLYKKYGMCEANLAAGGLGCSGWKPDQEWISRLKERNSGQKNPMFGKKHKKESKEKNNKSRKGKSLEEILGPTSFLQWKLKTDNMRSSLEWKKKISTATSLRFKGKPKSTEHRLKMVAHTRKSVLLSTGEKFDSISAALLRLGGISYKVFSRKIKHNRPFGDIYVLEIK